MLHLGVRASKPDPPISQTPSAEVVSLQEELRKLKHKARSVSVLSFPLRSEIQASRRELMWEVTGAKAHELRGESLSSPKMLRLCIASWITEIGRRKCCPRSPSLRAPAVKVADPAAARAAAVAVPTLASLEAAPRRAGRTLIRAHRQPRLHPPRPPHPRRRSQPPSKTGAKGTGKGKGK